MASTREAQVRAVLQQEVGRLRRFACSLTANRADADDLVHDVVVKALEKGLPERDDPIPWLLTLTKNLWIDRLRQQAVRARPGNEERMPTPVGDTSPHDALHLERVLVNLQQMPENLRVVLSLVAIEGLSYGETAEMLGVPIGTVMSRVARARAHLLTLTESNEAKS